jgi:hypothetical protein
MEGISGAAELVTLRGGAGGAALIRVRPGAPEPKRFQRQTSTPGALLFRRCPHLWSAYSQREMSEPIGLGQSSQSERSPWETSGILRELPIPGL